MKNPLANDIFNADTYGVGTKLIYLGQNTGMIKHLAKGEIVKIAGGHFYVKFSDTVSTMCTENDLNMYFCRDAMNATEVLTDSYDID